MTRVEKDGTKIYQTEDKQYKVKEQLLSSLFNCINSFPQIIVTSDKADPYSDPRFDAMTMLLTTFALSEDECIALLDERDDMIDELEDFDSMSDTERNRKIFYINIRTIAKCQANFDNYYGVKKRQEIMRIAPPKMEAEKEELGGDEFLGMMFGQSFEEGESSDD